jgi:hypothetical protein
MLLEVAHRQVDGVHNAERSRRRRCCCFSHMDDLVVPSAASARRLHAVVALVSFAALGDLLEGVLDDVLHGCPFRSTMPWRGRGPTPAGRVQQHPAPRWHGSRGTAQAGPFERAYIDDRSADDERLYESAPC